MLTNWLKSREPGTCKIIKILSIPIKKMDEAKLQVIFTNLIFAFRTIFLFFSHIYYIFNIFGYISHHLCFTGTSSWF